MFFTHFPAGGVRSQVEAGIFRGLGLKPGVPDLFIWLAGRCYALELKTDTKAPACRRRRSRRRTGGCVGCICALTAE